MKWWTFQQRNKLSSCKGHGGHVCLKCSSSALVSCLLSHKRGWEMAGFKAGSIIGGKFLLFFEINPIPVYVFLSLHFFRMWRQPCLLDTTVDCAAGSHPRTYIHIIKLWDLHTFMGTFYENFDENKRKKMWITYFKLRVNAKKKPFKLFSF